MTMRVVRRGEYGHGPRIFQVALAAAFLAVPACEDDEPRKALQEAGGDAGDNGMTGGSGGRTNSGGSKGEVGGTNGEGASAGNAGAGRGGDGGAADAGDDGGEGGAGTGGNGGSGGAACVAPSPIPNTEPLAIVGNYEAAPFDYTGCSPGTPNRFQTRLTYASEERREATSPVGTTFGCVVFNPRNDVVVQYDNDERFSVEWYPARAPGLGAPVQPCGWIRTDWIVDGDTLRECRRGFSDAAGALGAPKPDESNLSTGCNGQPWGAWTRIP
jgi:hypothetical protein